MSQCKFFQWELLTVHKKMCYAMKANTVGNRGTAVFKNILLCQQDI